MYLPYGLFVELERTVMQKEEVEVIRCLSLTLARGVNDDTAGGLLDVKGTIMNLEKVTAS